MSTELNLKRCRRLIGNAVRALDLDLSGLTVLTEAATGCYALTASIAAFAGADRVIALTRDSRFGSAADAANQTLSVAEALGVRDRIAVIRDRENAAITQADIVTNLGFVRPIDRVMLERLKRTAVVSLMFETWEFRRDDLDLDACREMGIAVLGTNESIPALRTLDYLTPVAMRLLFDCGIEVCGSNLLVLGAGAFADALERGLGGVAGSVRQFDMANAHSRDQLRAALPDADAIIVAEHVRREQLIGRDGYLSVAELVRANPGVALVHIAGAVDRAEIVAAGLICAPEHFAAPGFMSVTTAYVGPRPLIDLHAGGLKVGELLARARLAGHRATEAEAIALAASPVCQAFPRIHA
jgi:hypothetical protein